MIHRYIKHELRYSIVSKELFMAIILMSGLFIISIFLNYQNALASIDDFRHQMNYYIENDLDVSEDIDAPFFIFDADEDNVYVENPLSYTKYLVEQNIQNAHPLNSLSMLLETMSAYFPIVFVLLGLLSVNSDFKNKTLKAKTVYIPKAKYILSKKIALIINCAIVLLSALVICTIINSFVYDEIITHIDDNISKPIMSLDAVAVVKQLNFGFLVSVLFAIIGMILGLLFRSIYPGMIGIIIFTFVVPVLGKYDPRNIINYISQKVYNYYGDIQLEVKPGLNNWCIVILLAIIIFVSICDFIIVNKRSLFV